MEIVFPLSIWTTDRPTVPCAPSQMSFRRRSSSCWFCATVATGAGDSFVFIDSAVLVDFAHAEANAAKSSKIQIELKSISKISGPELTVILSILSISSGERVLRSGVLRRAIAEVNHRFARVVRRVNRSESLSDSKRDLVTFASPQRHAHHNVSNTLKLIREFDGDLIQPGEIRNDADRLNRE